MVGLKRKFFAGERRGSSDEPQNWRIPPSSSPDSSSSSSLSPLRRERSPSPDSPARRFVQKFGKRRILNDEKALSSAVVDLVQNCTREFPQLRVASGFNASFHRNALPELPLFEPGYSAPGTRETTAPRPTIALGYSPAVFNSYQHELQKGIISDAFGEPRDLGYISQPIDGVFWPFVVVDVQTQPSSSKTSTTPTSLTHECHSVASAVCNHPLMLLATSVFLQSSLAGSTTISSEDEAFLMSLSGAIHSFSLTIRGKMAVLSTHDSDFSSQRQAMDLGQEYRLDHKDDVQALMDRLRSLFEWAVSVRLQVVEELLERFGQRVSFSASLEDMSLPNPHLGKTVGREENWQTPFEVGPMDIFDSGMSKGSRTCDARQRNMRKVLKNMLVDSLPVWTRAEV